MEESSFTIPSPRSTLRNIALTFFAVTAVLAAFVAYTAYSRAVITVHLREVNQQSPFRIVVAEEPAADALKATFLETAVEASETVSLAADAEARTGKASGTVTLHNETGNAQPLVATTRLLTPEAVLFRLKKGVTVPANGTVTAEVEADKEDAAGEIGPTRFTIPGLNEALQKEIYATSSSAMVRQAAPRTVTERDVTAAKEAAKKQLVAKAIAQFASAGQTVTSEYVLLDGASEAVSAKAGDRASVLTATAKAKAIGVMVDGEALRAKVSQVIEGNVDANALAYTFGAYDPVLKTAVVTGEVATQAAADRNSSIFSPANFIGVTPEEAVSYLKNYKGVEDVHVSISPYWHKRLPRIPSRISVEFE